MRKDNPRKTLFVMLAAAALAMLFVLTGCGGDGDDDGDGEQRKPEPVGYKVTVTNNLMEKLAPIVVTHASNDAHLFTKDNYVTEAAEYQILSGWPCMVTDAIGEQAVSNHPTQPACVEENKVTVAPGESSEPIMFNGDATALRIIAMVAPSMVPDNYVSAVVNVAALEMPGDYITAPLSRFDIGDDEMTMVISRVDGDMDMAMTVGTVRVTRQ